MSIIGNMEDYYEEKMLYIVRDAFEEGYMSFLIPEAYHRHPGKEFLLIGSYIMEDPEYVMEKVVSRRMR